MIQQVFINPEIYELIRILVAVQYYLHSCATLVTVPVSGKYLESKI